MDPIDEDPSVGLDGPVPMRRAAEDGGRAPQKEKPSPTSESREDRCSRLKLTGICETCGRDIRIGTCHTPLEVGIQCIRCSDGSDPQFESKHGDGKPKRRRRKKPQPGLFWNLGKAPRAAKHAPDAESHSPDDSHARDEAKLTPNVCVARRARRNERDFTPFIRLTIAPSAWQWPTSPMLAW